eukprot:Pgem_evm1s7209
MLGSLPSTPNSTGTVNDPDLSVLTDAKNNDAEIVTGTAQITIEPSSDCSSQTIEVPNKVIQKVSERISGIERVRSLDGYSNQSNGSNGSFTSGGEDSQPD